MLKKAINCFEDDEISEQNKVVQPPDDQGQEEGQP